MVFLGFVTIWSFATPPTRYSPFSESATTLGSTRLPLSVGTTRGIRLRTCATQVLVVPRSMPRMDFSRVGEPGMRPFYHTPRRRPLGAHVDQGAFRLHRRLVRGPTARTERRRRRARARVLVQAPRPSRTAQG